MKIEVKSYDPQEDGTAILKIEYDDEFARFAVTKFILWSIEKQIEEAQNDNSLSEEG